MSAPPAFTWPASGYVNGQRVEPGDQILWTPDGVVVKRKEGEHVEEAKEATALVVAEPMTLAGVEAEAGGWLDFARELVIATPEDYEAACDGGREVSRLIGSVVESFKIPKGEAHDEWKRIVAEEKAALEPLEEAKKLYARKTADYREDQERRRREAERIAREAAERLERERHAAAAREAERLEAQARQEREAAARAAAELEAQGQAAAAALARSEAALRAEELEGAAAAVKAAPIPVVPAPVVPTSTPKVAGARGRETWDVRVVDLRELVQAVADGRASLEYVTANEAVLRPLVRALKSAFHVPGLEAVSTTGTSFSK